MATFDETINAETPSLKPRWLLRRHGNRALRVFERQKQQPAVAAFEVTLPAAVEAFTQLDKAIAAQEALVNAGEQANTDALKRVLRAALGMLGRDLPGFDARDFSPRPGVGDDVVDNSERLLEVLRQNLALSYAEQVMAELTRLIAAARVELEGTQARLGALQELRRDGRVAAGTLQKELTAFRAALKAVLGPSHRDVQALRDKRADGADDEEAEVANDTERPSTPA